MFTQKCFIRKNNEEITNNLVDFGYGLIPSAMWHEGKILICANGTCYSQDDIPHGDYIDCGSNTGLFLYVAALRDDSDKDQLFFHNEDTDCRYPIECIHNEFHMCTVDPDTCEFIDHKDNYHKGTPQEILKHFKTE